MVGNIFFRVNGAGDVNGDCYAAFLVGACYNDNGGEAAGAAYLVFNDDLAPGTAPFRQRQRPWGNRGDALPARFEQARLSVDFTANALADGGITVDRHIFHPCKWYRSVRTRRRDWPGRQSCC